MAKKIRPATTSGRSNIQGTSSRDGEEVGGVGSRYAAVLVERANKSFGQTDLAGPPGRPAVGGGGIGEASMGMRKTGRV